MTQRLTESCFFPRSTLLGTACCVALLTSCATFQHGISQRVGIASMPYKATVTIDGRLAGTTPLVAKLWRGRRHVVKIELEGYHPFEVTLSRRVSPWIVGNFVMPPFFAVDWATGGLYNLTPDQVTEALAKAAPSAARPAAGDISVILVKRADATWTRIGEMARR